MTNISKKFENGALVWALRRGRNGLPIWPGKVLPGFWKDPPKTKKKYLYVFFFATCNQDWIPENEVYDYFENVHRFTDLKYKCERYISAINYAHLQFWDSVKLKREHNSGFPISRKELILIQNEKKNAIEEMDISKSEEDMSVSKIICKSEEDLILAKRRFISHFVSIDNLVDLIEKKGFDEIRNTGTCDICVGEYGFLGIGNASLKLIQSLLATKHSVNVWSIDGFGMRDICEAGAKWCFTPADVISRSIVVFYCSRDPNVPKEILFVKNGMFDGCKKNKGENKIFVELTQVHEAEFEKCLKPLVNYQGGKYIQVKTLVPLISKRRSPIYLCAGEQEVFDVIRFCLTHVTRIGDIFHIDSDFGSTLPLEISPYTVVELEILSRLLPTGIASFENMRLDKEGFTRLVEKYPQMFTEVNKFILKFRDDDRTRFSDQLKYILNTIPE